MRIISHTPRKTPIRPPADFQNLNLLLTCQSGLESLVRKESERLGLVETGGQDRLVTGKGDLSTLYRLLIGSRYANRVYIEVAKEKITDFDALHDTLADISWGDYLTGREMIVVEASSTRSILSSTPTIQSVAQKAIFSTLHTPDNANAIETHILILIIDDIAHILLDVTGDPLHKRGYREEAGEAPLKENLAAALIAFSNWRFREPLSDPFCGSGTIAIEAAMMARNIPPGINRHFRIESLPFHDREIYMKTKEEMKAKIYPSGKYQIFASDMDREMIEIARRNAERAGVAEDISFSVSDYLSSRHPDEGRIQDPETQSMDSSQAQNDGTTGVLVVTNPPYGKRLESDNLDEIYKKLIHDVKESGGGFITTYPVDVRFGLANRKLLNGSEECRFWYRK